MKEISYLLLGWVLGLIGPPIVDTIKRFLRKREITAALRIELEDLQYRLTISSMLLGLKYGRLDKTFLTWIQPIVESYSGNEPNITIREVIRRLLTIDDVDVGQAAEIFRSQEGMGSSLKLFQAKFLESQLVEIAKMRTSTQRKIHEFRNQLDTLNQEIAKTDSYMKMTFDGSLSEENFRRVNAELNSKYNFVQDRCRLAADKITAILSEQAFRSPLGWKSRVKTLISNTSRRVRTFAAEFFGSRPV
jgi:hypothetical protein